MKVINDLFDYENFKIVQDTDFFKFSLDSILLAEFVDEVKENFKILDLCSGNGAVSLILSYYYSNKIVAFELQKKVCELFQESLVLNNKNEQITIVNDDVKMIKKYFPGNTFDVIMANPPYFKYINKEVINKNSEKAIARHEIYLDLEQLFLIVKYALRNQGYFYLVHLPERLEEILVVAHKNNIIAKKIQFVYTKDDKSANIVLIKLVKGARSSVEILAPLMVNDYKSYKNIFRK